MSDKSIITNDHRMPSVCRMIFDEIKSEMKRRFKKKKGILTGAGIPAQVNKPVDDSEKLQELMSKELDLNDQIRRLQVAIEEAQHNGKKLQQRRRESELVTANEVADKIYKEIRILTSRAKTSHGGFVDPVLENIKNKQIADGKLKTNPLHQLKPAVVQAQAVIEDISDAGGDEHKDAPKP